jgi:plastocyanin
MRPLALTILVLGVAVSAVTRTATTDDGPTGAIGGRVDVRRPAADSDRRPTVAHLGAPAERRRVSHTRAVVYLETAPRGAFEQTEPGRAVMDQRQETFVPHLLAITTGTTVEFPNSDRIFHNVFSLSKPARFDLGRYPVGRSKSVRFDKPGVVRVFCDIHSHMNAFILVFSHRYFTLTDDQGRYRLDNVPAGTYTVVAWYEGAVTAARPVVVSARGTAELDFALR